MTTDELGRDPDLIVEIEAVHFIRLVTGNASGPKLFLKGDLQLDGDLLLAQRLPRPFRPARCARFEDGVGHPLGDGGGCQAHLLAQERGLAVGHVAVGQAEAQHAGAAGEGAVGQELEDAGEAPARTFSSTVTSTSCSATSRAISSPSSGLA